MRVAVMDAMRVATESATLATPIPQSQPNPTHQKKRITSLVNYTTWTDAYDVEIFYRGAATGPVSIGKVPYPAFSLPPFGSHVIRENGTFLNVRVCVAWVLGGGCLDAPRAAER